MINYNLLTEKEAKKYKRFWDLYSLQMCLLDWDTDVQLKTQIIHLISIAVDTCNSCYASNRNCQCWNDE